MKPLLLGLAFLLPLSLAVKADDSVPRGNAVSSGFDPDLAAQFSEIITSTSPMAVAPTDPLSISGSFAPTRALTVTGSVALSGSVQSQVTGVAGSGSNGNLSGAYSTFDGTTNGTSIQIYPKNLPAGAYQVYVVTRDGEWHSVGSFVMPAIISTASDGPNNTLIFNNQLILQPTPVAPLPDNDFLPSSNSLNYDWLESGIVRFATDGMPDLTYKPPKGSKTQTTNKVAVVPTKQFNDTINPFDIAAIVVQNAYTGKNILSSPLQGTGSWDTTNTNLLSLVLPCNTDDAAFAGGIANLKTSFSRSKTKTTKSSSLNFSATGLPANETYAIEINGELLSGSDSKPYKVTTNSKGSLVITCSSLSKKKTVSGLTVIGATDLAATDIGDLSQVATITVNATALDNLGNTVVGDPVLWVSF